MRSRQLLKAIGEIDDRFIDEAAEVRTAARPAARRNRRRGLAAAAACLLVAAGVSFTVLPGMLGGANKASPENTAAGSTSHFDLDDNRAGSPAPEQSLNVKDAFTQDAQYEESLQIAKPGAGSDIVTRRQEVFRDAPRALWHETVNGR